MAKPHQRVFALVLAALFLATSVAAAGAVAWQISQDSKVQEELVDQSSQNDQLKAFEESMQACNISQPVEAAKEDVPEVFKPKGKVKELQKTDLEKGTGKEAKSGDCLVVKYHGTLAKDGKKFDGNFDKETALQFSLGMGMVIPGWDQGMVGVKEGGTRRLVIPSSMGYGESGSGESIPPNSDLVFVVKLLEIKEKD